MAEEIAELGIDGESFANVVLGGAGVHEVAVAAFAQWCQPDQLATGPDGGGQLGPTDAESGCGIAFECTQSQEGELISDLVDPGGVLGGEEVALADEEGGQGGSPGSGPL